MTVIYLIRIVPHQQIISIKKIRSIKSPKTRKKKLNLVYVLSTPSLYLYNVKYGSLNKHR